MSDDPNTRLVPRCYLDHEKEEVWLNAMAARGWNLLRRGLLGYRFHEGTPGEYTYRVRLLPDWAIGENRHQYFEFMWDSGVEVVCKAGRWGYFRKPTAEGPFEMSADLDSLIRRATRGAWALAIPALILLPVSLRLFDRDMTSRFAWADSVGLLLLVASALLGFYAFRGFGNVRTLVLRKQAGK